MYLSYCIHITIVDHFAEKLSQNHSYKAFFCDSGTEANEAAYLGGCSHECRVHPRNRYVVSHNLSEAEVTERLHAIHEIVASIK